MQRQQEPLPDQQQSIESAFRTPNKQQRQGEAFRQYLTPFFSSKLKGFASKIRSNTYKRFKMREQGGEVRLVFWSQLKQVSDFSKTKASTSTAIDGLSVYEVDSLARKARISMLKMESSNCQKKQKTRQLLRMLDVIVGQNMALKVEMRRLNRLNHDVAMLNNYGQYLKQKQQQQMQCINRLHHKTTRAQQELKKIHSCTSQITLINHQIVQKRHNLELCEASLIDSNEYIGRIMKEKMPHSMINCMFIVGILSQQIHVLILQKKERNSQKANRPFKIYQKLARREVHINGLNSLVVQFRVVIAIYMHCKSLTLTNIAAIMNSLSFFAEEFKQLYHFWLFQDYAISLVDRSKCTHQINQSRLSQLSDAQTIKKPLLLSISSNHEPFLRSVLRVFEYESGQYCIFLNTFKMSIEVAVEDEWPSNSQQKDPIASECNTLRINFTSIPSF